MATQHNKLLIVAGIILIISFIGPSLFTGTLSGWQSAENTRDFSVKRMIYPPIIYTNSHTATRIVISNKGTLPATFVEYEYSIWNEHGGEVFRSGDRAYITSVPVGDSTRYISTVMFPKPGKYKVRVTMDPEKKFSEINEDNNVYETTVTVI